MVLIFAIILFVLLHLIESELRKRRQAPSLPENCQRCSHEVSNDLLICPACKSLLHRHCKGCGQSHSVQHQFCPWCGVNKQNEVAFHV